MIPDVYVIKWRGIKHAVPLYKLTSRLRVMRRYLLPQTHGDSFIYIPFFWFAVMIAFKDPDVVRRRYFWGVRLYWRPTSRWFWVPEGTCLYGRERDLVGRYEAFESKH